MLKTSRLVIIYSVVFLGSKFFVVVRPLLSAVLVAASADHTVPEVGRDAILEFSLVVVVLHVPRLIGLQRLVLDIALVQIIVEKIVAHVCEDRAQADGLWVGEERRVDVRENDIVREDMADEGRLEHT